VEKDKIQNQEVTIEELNNLPQESYTLIDIREEAAYNHGHLQGAINIFLGDLEKILTENSKEQIDRTLEEQIGRSLGKEIVLYCSKGLLSEEPAKALSSKGLLAYHLAGGYISWLREHFQQMDKEALEAEEPRHLEIERSIRKKFHRRIFSKFAKAINQYELLQEGDKVAVCISGGKDSMLLAKLFQELQRHNKFHFDLVFLIMNPGYSPDNLEIIKSNTKLLNIPYTIFETDIFDSVFNVEKSPCYLCARMRRGHLYSKAKELGCNKIALGHHYDDVIETILMGMLYGAQVQTMMPKLHSTNFEGMELIRPMYLVREDDIKHWCSYNHLYFIQCACRFTDTCNTCQPDGTATSKRMEIKQLIAKMKKTNPFVESNIFKSVENVNLDTVIAYKEKGERHHFLDEYGRRNQMERNQRN
jgi:tRNA(Ile)-lysidine synthase TilS/MesJ/rhodanese-related sulfurtransferase